MFKALQAIFYTCQIFISLQNVKSFTDYFRFNPSYIVCVCLSRVRDYFKRFMSWSFGVQWFQVRDACSFLVILVKLLTIPVITLHLLYSLTFIS